MLVSTSAVLALVCRSAGDDDTLWIEQQDMFGKYCKYPCSVPCPLMIDSGEKAGAHTPLSSDVVFWVDSDRVRNKSPCVDLIKFSALPTSGQGAWLE